MELWHAVILAVIEGITEYLPISSTGHMIIASSFMGIQDDAFTKSFTIIIQFGAILAVLLLYWKRFLASWTFYQKLLIAFLPAAVLGLMFAKKIDEFLGSIVVVAAASIVGGIILIILERSLKHRLASDTGPQDVIASRAPVQSDQEISLRKSFVIGCYQCLALVPGMSRSASSIIGGLLTGLTRKEAAEFSFFLGVPTLAAATAYKVLKLYKTIEPGQVSLLIIGNVISFIVAALAIRTFIGFVTRRGFTAFGIYRIVLGVIILALYFSGQGRL